MDTKEAAAALNGCQYTKEGSDELFAAMKAAGLVAVFGASDDLMELRGAIYDEIGCYGGGEVPVTDHGLPHNQCSSDDCPYFADLIGHYQTIEAVWGDKDIGTSWSYRTSIPHETFDIMEDGDLYCRGIVFRLVDATARTEQET
jgi:hypothetical protein